MNDETHGWFFMPPQKSDEPIIIARAGFPCQECPKLKAEIEHLRSEVEQWKLCAQETLKDKLKAMDVVDAARKVPIVYQPPELEAAIRAYDTKDGEP